MKNELKIFNDTGVRTVWDSEREEWYFSVVDVCGVLSESAQPRKYWNDLKKKLNNMGSELSEKIGQLKLQSSDGKYYKTDVLDTKGILRLIQSIPSKNAEPFKMWLANVGSERLGEIADPEKAIVRGQDYYRAKGYTDGWIKQRMQAMEMRKKLTDEWQERGVTRELDYAILTNEMTKAWSGLSIKEYKSLKGLKKENLRDNMTDIELVLNMLAEITTTRLSQKEQPDSMYAHKDVAVRGGSIASRTRGDYEELIGESVVTSLNANDKQLLDTKLINNEDKE